MDKLLFECRKWLYKKRRDLNSIILLIASCLILLFIIVGYNSIFKPLQIKYKEQINTIYTYNSNISVLPELSLSADIMNAKLDNIKDIYSKLSNIVPDERNVPFVTSQISLAAANNSVDIYSMSKVLETSVTLGITNFDVVKYNLICFSTYEDIVNLLATLETSSSIFAIETIDIEPSDDASIVKTTLDINIYMKSNA